MPLPTRVSLHHLPAFAQWAALIALAAASGQLLTYLGIPAALFLGPMFSGIVFGVGGASIRLPRLGFRLGQGCIGLLVAHAIGWPVLLAMVQDGWLMLVGTLLTLLLSVLVSLVMARFSGIPGNTSAWGSMPGAASAMVGIAESHGADPRVVASMQYVRVVCVVTSGALVSRLLGIEGAGGAAHATPLSLDQGSLLNLLQSLLVIVVGVFAGGRLPAGSLIVPLLAGALLQLTGLLHISLPAWLLASAYGAIGCYIGLRFDRASLRSISRHLPAMAASSLLLILACALGAAVLAHLTGIDFLSMYLATSPGGLDAMSI
ncbi:MAG: hypothetical protein GAK45_00840 [Pseudomonas citronellolis]|nr:MAG: hypothetical protein GAK45_00840 [Pseudomonas citronellolis]